MKLVGKWTKNNGGGWETDYEVYYGGDGNTLVKCVYTNGIETFHTTLIGDDAEKFMNTLKEGKE